MKPPKQKLSFEELLLYCAIHKDSIFVRTNDYNRDTWINLPLSQVKFNSVLHFIDIWLDKGIKPQRMITVPSKEQTATSPDEGKKENESEKENTDGKITNS